MLTQEQKEIVYGRVQKLQNTALVKGFYASLLLGGDGVRLRDIEEYIENDLKYVLGLTPQYVLHDDDLVLIGKYDKLEDVPQDTYVENTHGEEVYVGENQYNTLYLFDRKGDSVEESEDESEKGTSEPEPTESSNKVNASTGIAPKKTVQRFQVGQAVVAVGEPNFGTYGYLKGKTGVITKVYDETKDTDYEVVFPQVASIGDTLSKCTFAFTEEELQEYAGEPTTKALSRHKEHQIAKVSEVYRKHLGKMTDMHNEILQTKENLKDKTLTHMEYVRLERHLKLLESEHGVQVYTSKGISLAREVLFDEDK